MEELRKEGRGESQREGCPAQRPMEGEERKGREGGSEGEGLVEGARWGRSAEGSVELYSKERRAIEKEGTATCP